MMATVGTSAVVEPLDAKKRWVFKTTQNDDLIAAALLKHMVKNGVKTVGFIGFNDPYGENWLKVFGALGEKSGHQGRRQSSVTRRTDPSVTGQTLKLIAAKPDAMLIAAVGGPAVLPQATLRDQGYKGHDLSDARGRDRRLHQARQGQGRRAPCSRQGRCSSSTRSPTRIRQARSRSRYIAAYEKQFGTKPATFGANTWDAGLLLERAIPVALKTAKPGTEAFRSALRDALEKRARGRRHARACSTCRRRITTAWTSARACWSRFATASSGCCPSSRTRRDGPRANFDGTHRRHPACGGQGARFGGDKLLAPISTPVRAGSVSAPLGAAARGNLVDAMPDSIAVVRPRDAQLAAHFSDAGLRVVPCMNAGDGMGATLACGIAATADADGWVIALADMPWIAPATIRAIAEAVAAGADIVAPSYRGQRGHPVGFSRRHRDALASLTGDAGARSRDRAHIDRLTWIDVDDAGVVRDVDTRADLDADR